MSWSDDFHFLSGNENNPRCNNLHCHDFNGYVTEHTLDKRRNTWQYSKVQALLKMSTLSHQGYKSSYEMREYKQEDEATQMASYVCVWQLQNTGGTQNIRGSNLIDNEYGFTVAQPRERATSLCSLLPCFWNFTLHWLRMASSFSGYINVRQTHILHATFTFLYKFYICENSAVILSKIFQKIFYVQGKMRGKKSSGRNKLINLYVLYMCTKSLIKKPVIAGTRLWKRITIL